MNLFQKYLLDEFVEDYQENRISRREALKLIASIVGSMVVANSILSACTPLDETATVLSEEASPTSSVPSPASTSPAPASPTTSPQASVEASATPQTAEATSALPAGAVHGTVTADDPMVNASAVEFTGQADTLQGYLSRPSSGEPAPLILVCHENRGLTEHIQDVTRRLAKAGYVALAVDLLSRQGGSAALSSSDIPGLLTGMSPDQYVQDFLDGWRWLQGQSFAQTDRVGMTGFCYGGGVTWRVATQFPELKAAVPFYGPHPEPGDIPNIQAAILAVYGERDARINQGIAAIEEAMLQNGKIYEKIIYPDSDHAFFNDTGDRYNPAAAQDAWMQMLAWFQQYV
jgi:carboxymethylenebutenolidase